MIYILIFTYIFIFVNRNKIETKFTFKWLWSKCYFDYAKYWFEEINIKNSGHKINLFDYSNNYHKLIENFLNNNFNKEKYILID